MPPFLPRKRLASTPPDSPQSRSPPSKKSKISDSRQQGRSKLQLNREFTLGGDEDSDSPLSDVESDEFEDIPQANAPARGEARDEDEDSDDVEWEDAVTEERAVDMSAAEPKGDLKITLSKDNEGDTYGSLAAALGSKKGPTKNERRVRIQAHCMHVQFLMFHNAIRNNWTGNKELQEILVKQLPAGISKEIERWRIASGLAEAPAPEISTPKKDKNKKRGRRSEKDDRNERDWAEPSQRLEKGKPDMSHGDPLISLLKVLAAYWKKRFTITAPGLRKNGYHTSAKLRDIRRSFQHDKHDPEKHGEKIKDLGEFKDLARKSQGSRDVGSQLFTALLRGIGIEARMVASLQPLGFGWTKHEDATSKAVESKATLALVESSDDDVKTQTPKGKAKNNAQNKRKSKGRGRAESPIDLDLEEAEDDDDSVVDVTPTASKSKFRRYDRDLPYPIYWTEAISPITHKPIPVSPFIGANAVATTEELLSAFEPRGAKAEKAKQVIAYAIAFSPDGSAKDVTTRYLKKHMWPGKTKGFRMPVEKVPIYNKRGKIARYEDLDWFKTVMSGYTRRDEKRTPVDDIEDSTDLVPKRIEKKKVEEEGDTLQALKASDEFVLERHLRREEALRAGAQIVRTFQNGKGDDAKEENVYLRSDVERCLSAESWHKEGRKPKLGETPLKQVPIRAVTLIRKREIEEAQRVTGEKPTQGLYSRDQTEYIIPPPIKDGIIPKNAFGNIDCFVPSMIPKGAVYVPLRGTVRICKKLEIDFAEAVTGFEFGNKRAVPVITGVVVPRETEHAVIDAWEAYEEERRIKEEGKQEKLILALWRKMIMGLRIRERIQDEYGDVSALDVSLPNDAGASANQPVHITDDNDKDDGSVGGGGFLMSDEEQPEMEELEVEDNGHDPLRRRRLGAAASYPTPASATSTKAAPHKQSEASSPESSELSPLSEQSTSDEDLGESETTAQPKISTRGKARILRGKQRGSESSRSKTASTSVDKPPFLSAENSKSATISTEDEDEEEADHPSVESEEEEEEYKPKPTRTRGSAGKYYHIPPRSENTSARGVTAKPETPRRKGLRKGGDVTSPYF